jgi:hypothetical protein
MHPAFNPSKHTPGLEVTLCQFSEQCTDPTAEKAFLRQVYGKRNENLTIATPIDEFHPGCRA